MQHFIGCDVHTPAGADSCLGESAIPKELSLGLKDRGGLCQTWVRPGYISYPIETRHETHCSQEQGSADLLLKVRGFSW
jgi:hypothetical protein